MDIVKMLILDVQQMGTVNQIIYIGLNKWLMNDLK